MQAAVEVGSPGFDRPWARKLFSSRRALLRFLLSISRQLRPEPLEATISRAVDQAFAEFAKEMKR